MKCQTLSFFFFSTQVWASSCVERHCAKDSRYREAEEGSFVCSGMVFLQAQAKSTPGHSWLILGRLPLQPPRAGAGPRGPDVLSCVPSQNVTSAVCPAFSLCPYGSSLSSVMNNSWWNLHSLCWFCSFILMNIKPFTTAFMGSLHEKCLTHFFLLNLCFNSEFTFSGNFRKSLWGGNPMYLTSILRPFKV